jgi:hypothetical protein
MGIASRNKAFSLPRLLAAVCIVALLAILVIRNDSVDPLELKIAEGFGLISEELHFYTDLYRQMPPPVFYNTDGVPLYSWRLKMLVAITNVPDVDMHKAWNVAPNMSLAEWPCWVFCYTADSGKSLTDTNLFAISGVGTAFDSSTVVRPEDLDADVILAMEVANSGINWVEPGDYEITDLEKWQGKLQDSIRPLVDNRIHILFADGQMWAIRGDVPVERVKCFFTINSAVSHSRDKELGTFCLHKWTNPGVVKGED